MMEERLEEEIMFWRKNLRDLNGWNMSDSEDVVYCKEGCVNMFSDASNVEVAGARIESEEVCLDTVFEVALSEKERVESSTFRELREIEECLMVHGSSLQGKIVCWGCDNWSAGKIVKWGSMKKDCHDVAVRIQEMCRSWSIRLETFWN